MIRMFSGEELAANWGMSDQMYRSRARLFRDRLGWNVDVDDAGWERDAYDAFNPIYVVVTDDNNRHMGSMRLMATTGPHMTADHFSHLTGGGPIRSPVIWEVTRFCVEQSDRVEGSVMQRASLELMLAAHELASYSGVEQFIATFDPRMRAIYKLAGWEPDIMGFQGKGRDRIFAGVWDVEPTVAAMLRNRLGLSHPLVTSNEALAAFHGGANAA